MKLSATQVILNLTAMTALMFTLAIAMPSTTSSKRKDGTEKGTLHQCSNKEHGFIWFKETPFNAAVAIYVHLRSEPSQEDREANTKEVYESNTDSTYKGTSILL
ncbi:hypothetical protein B9Z19DRAFT_1063221 [Tuber borchii]|uniref:Uncharacterized protein n=1 Tax=Tuber borchii TaxID=42251 RepID=A0A2T6ZZ71_TUBBO|nr:hypothetical protein B9Z19DRAFT_1063221 [Tuber borchii]